MADQTPSPLPRKTVETAVRSALEEDMGRSGDLTSQAVVPAGALAEGAIVSREKGVLAGLDLAVAAFHAMNENIDVSTHFQDGNALLPGDAVVSLRGPARDVLAAERVALNYLGHLSGIASQTSLYVQETAGSKARITCTRKTTPNLRALEKYAVRCGGGYNHRFGLDDGILIKDNHIAVAGGVAAAVKAALAGAGHMVRVEIEVDTLEQLHEALEAGAQAVLLDNMPPETLREAVAIIDGRAVAEASGNVTLQTVKAIAETGVDYISVGRITHSAPCLDLGLDFEITL
ncbi:MAG: carboxylating nicotinate-nucleotide diphosphorylase [Parvibaculales bacterium]